MVVVADNRNPIVTGLSDCFRRQFPGRSVHLYFILKIHETNMFWQKQIIYR